MSGVSVFGANSLARLLVELIREDGGIVERVVVDDEHWTCADFHGVPLVKYTSVPTGSMFLSAIGYRELRARRRVFDRLTTHGHRLTNFVSSRAIVSRSVEMGTGNIVLPGVIIEPFARLGSGNLIWSHSLICHEVVVGSHNYIAANCVVGGLSRVGNLCFMGNASATLDAVTVADETHLLPGCVLFEDTDPHTRYFGSPARAIGLHRDTGIIVER